MTSNCDHDLVTFVSHYYFGIFELLGDFTFIIGLRLTGIVMLAY